MDSKGIDGSTRFSNLVWWIDKEYLDKSFLSCYEYFVVFCGLVGDLSDASHMHILGNESQADTTDWSG